MKKASNIFNNFHTAFLPGEKKFLNLGKRLFPTADDIARGVRQEVGKYQPEINGLCDWTFKTNVIIVCDSFLRKPISIVYCLSLL